MFCVIIKRTVITNKDIIGIIWLEVLVRLVLYSRGYWSGWYYIAGGTGQADVIWLEVLVKLVWLKVLVRQVLYGGRYWSGWYYIAGDTGQADVIWLEY